MARSVRWLWLALTACEAPAKTIPACVELAFDVENCAPQYQPQYENLYTNTFEPACATAGNSCHADEEASGARPSGLSFGDPDVAYDALLGESDGHPFLNVEVPACSLLLVRLGIDDEDIRMPPGESPRSEAELCAIAQWMRDGAPR